MCSELAACYVQNSQKEKKTLKKPNLIMLEESPNTYKLYSGLNHT